MSDSLGVYLQCAAPDSAASRAWEEAAMSAEGRLPPPVRVAGASRTWTIEQQGTLYRDGVFAVTTDIARNGERLVRNGAVRLTELDGISLDATLRRLSVRTAAHLSFDELMGTLAYRPHATESEIRRCRDRLRNPALQYLTGRGAQRDVVEPWERWLGAHEDHLLRLERAWLTEVLPVLEETAPDDPLAPILEPLRLLQISRETREIIHEYRTRLASLSRECQRVAAEIGVLGTLFSLALVPVTETLGPFFLAPVLIAGTLYYLGYAIARRFSGASPAVALPRPRAASPGSGAPGIAAVLARMTVAPVRILSGPRLAAADLGCALALQLETMHASQRDDRLSAVSVNSADVPGDHVRVVIGGPLVRAPLSLTVEEACRLTDEGGAGWHFSADGHRIAAAEDEEQLGSISASVARDDVLFVVGTRDAGTVAALRWLRYMCGTHAPDVRWVLVDARGAVGEPAHGGALKSAREALSAWVAQRRG
ncbi:MAG: hypothetical protein M3401_03790 [Actinomycetota bacterium]|nr:hypothetical protein [Actinomycetota bacterium]